MLREHFKKDGTPKKSFEKFALAEKHGIRVGNQRAYKCSFCGKYHVATDSGIRRYTGIRYFKTNKDNQHMSGITEAKRIIPQGDDRPVVYNDISTDLVSITPELAAEWLEQNRNIRNLRPHHVEALAYEITSGNWSSDTFEYIRFNQYGDLVDGQHRLAAIIKADQSVLNAVLWGLQDGDVMKIDSGLSRTTGDILGYYGVKDGRDVASSYKLIMLLMTKPSMTMYRGGSKPSAKDVIAFEQDNPEIRDSIALTKDVKTKLVGKLMPSQVTAIHFLITKKYGKEMADEFFTTLSSGLGLTEGNAIHILRERLIRNKSDVQAKMTRENQVFLTIKAFQKWRQGIDTQVIRLGPSEVLPSI